MRFFIIILVFTIVGSSVSDSIFTTNRKASFNPDDALIASRLDEVYPNVAELVEFDFANLINEWVTDTEIINHVTVVRQGYVPYYTERQVTINSGKISAQDAITGNIITFRDSLNNIENKYQEMLDVFASRSCSNFAAYETMQGSNLDNLMIETAALIENFHENVRYTIPKYEMKTFAMQLLQVIHQYSSILKMELIQQKEETFMVPIANTYYSKTGEATGFIEGYLYAIIASQTAKLNTALDEMVAGAQMATCT